MAWSATAYLKEARDAHGRWISGAGQLGSTIDDLVKSGKIDKATAKTVAAAIARHTEHGRGLPADAEHNHAKMLEYLAQTMRHDSLVYRNQKPPDISESKRLSRAARAVETAHAAHTGQPRKNMPGKSAFHLTPDSKPLDGPSGETKVVPIATKLKQKAEPKPEPKPEAPVVHKAEATVSHPQGDVDPHTVKVGDKIQTSTGSRTVKSIRAWANGDLTLRWADGEGKKSTTYKPGVRVRHADGSAPAPTQAPAPKMTRAATPPKAKATEPKLKVKAAVPKVKQKMQSVKISAENIKVGDILDMGQARIKEDPNAVSYHVTYKRMKMERPIVAVSRDENGSVSISLGQPLDERLRDPFNPPQIVTQKGYGWGGKNLWGGQSIGEMDQTLKPNAVIKVRRLTEVQQAAGSKVGLAEHPDARTYAQALAQALENDDDLTALDPAFRKVAPGQSVGHTQQLLFDMALGKRSGRVGNREVVSNDEYRRRLETNGELPALTQQAEESTPYTRFNTVTGSFKESGSQPTLPHDATEIQLAKLFHAVSSHGYGSAATQARQQWAENWEATHNGQKPSIHDYADSLSYDDVKQHLQPSSGYDTSAVERYLKVPRKNELTEKTDKVIADRIKSMREAEGTADREYNIPQWDHVKMEPHTWESVNREIAKQADPHKLTLSDGTIATRDFVPSFYTAGLVDDGVLYHRQVNRPLDGYKLVKGIQDVLRESGTFGNAYGPDIQEANIKNASTGWVPDLSNPPTMDALREKLTGMPTVTIAETKFKQGMTDLLDTIERRTRANGAIVTDGHIATGPANNSMRKIMEEAGAVSMTDPTRGTYTGSWTTLKPGQMLVLAEGARDLTPEEKWDEFKKRNSVNQQMPAFPTYSTYGEESQALRQRWKEVQSIDGAQQVLDDYKKFATKATAPGSNVNAKSKRALNAFAKDKQGVIDSARNAKKFEASGKRIEYVPWQQDNGPTVTPRSDRGRLTLHGYTAEEAAARLHELGVVGTLEPHIPADSIFRSGRRSGNVLPLHSDYVRGEALPPTTDRLLQHGLTAWKGSKSSQTLESIARTGGLQSIAERHRRGIKAAGASPTGDSASGIDHVVFLSYGGGGAVGSGAGVKLLMRPDVLLRRDVVVSNTDYGGGKNRYNMYKGYRDKLEAKAGEEVGKTDLWTPLSPAARQSQLDNVAKHPGSAENNVAGSVHMNDVAAIQANSPEERAEIERMLKDLQAEGIIDRVPVVVERDLFNDMATGKKSLEGTATTTPSTGPGSLAGVAEHFKMGAAA